MSDNENNVAAAPEEGPVPAPTPEAGVDVNPFEVPFKVLENIAHTYGKDVMLLVGYDEKLGTTQVLTFGRTKEQAQFAESGGRALQTYLQNAFGDGSTEQERTEHQQRYDQPQDNYDEEGMRDLNNEALNLGDLVRFRYNKMELRGQVLLSELAITDLPLARHLRDGSVGIKYDQGGERWLWLPDFQNEVKTYSIRRISDYDA